MGPQAIITNAVFNAFLKCKMKAHLLLDGAEGVDADVPRWQQGLTSAFEQPALQRLRSRASSGQIFEGLPPLRALESGRYHLLINPVISVPGLRADVQALERVTVGRGAPQYAFCPIRFMPNAKLTRLDKLAVAFDALALSRLLGWSPPVAKIIHGPEYTATTVRLPKLVDEARSLIAELTPQKASAAPPPLILNKHCPACEFQSRCRQIATEQDDLSLIRTVNEKERAKQNAKGIFTVTQLSYTYRPRRHSAHPSALRLKHEPALKALAIRKQCVHVVGTPRFTIPANAVYLDVEGIPDRNFYYLVGLRYRRGDMDVHDAFWADDPWDEREMWAACLRALTLIRDPVLVHYGSYETQFLKNMKARYHETSEESEFMNRLIASSVNILSPLHSQVYFPTYSNSLKEIARYLGYGWSEANASGLRALMWRSEWEEAHAPSLKQRLLTYNAEDCEAAQRVAEAVAAICSEQPVTGPQARSVNVDLLERDYPWRFGALAYAIPEFKPINEAAYWDYQRTKVYARSNKRLHRVSKAAAAKRKKDPPVNTSIQVPENRPDRCPKCGSDRLNRNGRLRSVIFDLRFTATGVKRWVIQKNFIRYQCWVCKSGYNELPRQEKYGRSLKAYVLYQMIELRVSQNAIARNLAALFGYRMSPNSVSCIKTSSSKQYHTTYKGILDKISAGKLVHADETKIIANGETHFVWVFTNMENVAYIYSGSREANTAHEVLRDFRGVLVSDFYAAYDAINVAQQKCLIHLLRDINEDVLRHPFNDEMVELAHSFGQLLKPIIETIDRFGLKAYHLRKHKRAVARFFDTLARHNYQAEVATGYQKRFEKNRNRLFTFLDHDGVPWNNNNAEHAIKAFARLRNIMGVRSTPKGIHEYLILLSISETCNYKNLSFLDFLRSGDIDIDVFAARSRAYVRCFRTN